LTSRYEARLPMDPRTGDYERLVRLLQFALACRAPSAAISRRRVMYGSGPPSCRMIRSARAGALTSG